MTDRPAPPPGPVLEVGRVARAHGIRGSVVVDLVTDRHERLEPGSVLSTDEGDLTVVAARPFGRRWLVDFEGVADRNQAEQLAGSVLRAAAIEDPDELWVHDLVGREVVEADGTPRGPVVELQANPAADLLVLSSGALVPLTFVVDVSADRIVVDVPAGLFE
jgi:16S rRNA processing protein RimM